MTTDLAKTQAQEPQALAYRHEMTVEDLVGQVRKVQQVMEAVMKQDEHYGVIPGTGNKPTLLKPGAEKLCLLFRLAPGYDTSDDAVDAGRGGHLTVVSKCLLTHIPTGQLWGTGEGSCSTRESKYAYRTAKRVCPECGHDAINKSKYPPKDRKLGSAPGWYCFAKQGGCGKEFSAGDERIAAQVTGRVSNEDLADQYNTVRKMANKRALVAAVLNVTAASDIFTQDLEDLPHGEPVNAQIIEAVASGERVAPPEPSAETLFPTPEDDTLRASLVAEAQRLSKALKLTVTDRNNYRQTYLDGGDVTTAEVAAVTELVNALRARANEPKWGEEARA